MKILQYYLLVALSFTGIFAAPTNITHGLNLTKGYLDNNNNYNGSRHSDDDKEDFRNYHGLNDWDPSDIIPKPKHTNYAGAWICWYSDSPHQNKYFQILVHTHREQWCGEGFLDNLHTYRLWPIDWGCDREEVQGRPNFSQQLFRFKLSNQWWTRFSLQGKIRPSVVHALEAAYAEKGECEKVDHPVYERGDMRI